MTSLARLRKEVTSSSQQFSFDYAALPAELVRLDCNELGVAPDEEEWKAFRDAFSKVVLHRYPDVSGTPLREALARHWSVEPDELLLGNGSVETIAMLIQAFGTNTRGRVARVAFPVPTFPLYATIARHHGAEIVPVPLLSDFSLDEARFAEAMERERPGLCFVASPNNPTGNRVERAALLRLAQRCDGAFVVDEAYADFDGPSLIDAARRTEGLFVMRSLSKVGFAGLRIGALIGHRKAIAEIDKVRIPWNVNALSIALGTALLSRPDKLRARVASVIRARQELSSALARLPHVKVFPSAANFVLVRLTCDADLAFQGLLERGVLVRNVASPGLLDRCLRISVGTENENERCVSALRAVLAGLP